MRRIFFKLIMAIVAVTGNVNVLYSQSIPFIERGKIWQMIQFTPESQVTDERPEHYTLFFSEDEGKDISVNGKTYSPLYSSREETPVAYLREEAGKVFMLQSSDNEEMLVYNFGANIGDHFDVYSIPEKQWAECSVTEVKSFGHGGIELKDITVCTKSKSEESYTVTNHWLEGLGTMDDNGALAGCISNILLDNKGQDTSRVAFVNSCGQSVPFTINERNFHGMEIALGDKVVPGTEEYEEWMSKGMKGFCKYEFTGNSLHITGVMNNNYGTPYYLVCDVDENKNIYLEFLEMEPVTTGMSVNKLDITIPDVATSPGMYTVIQQGEQVSVEYITTSVNSAYNPRVSKTYDIQGRGITHMVPKGMYIKDARKVARQ